ncbi:hypothetical protein B0F90DRAFT_1748139 [Multifurca ochricompacta]|uniref:Uncharacterized protein n=1 Tax=Multifurca ochricompacta TaxID=376703 RepID=A0AAD4QL92_9AGAM|nr:hypothetical protein B0F90DRAFT_1748139 [Multifurca ochricompacta]
MLTDDLPWPELGNVSRGATRGNQGQKGVLSPPNPDGRSLIQLRVQPGVLTVLLNRQATEWYRTLDTQVNHALKLTKTYWRKARRRQDYDPVADQDHMELHEWLQQLKDKVMSHLELLMQRGDIKGPPYIMPDNVELTFLRKFIERQAAGIPHNPRLRKAFLENRYTAPPTRLLPPPPSESPEPSDDSVLDGTSSDDGWDGDRRHLTPDRSVSRYSGPISTVSYPTPPIIKSSPRLASIRSLEEEAESSSVHLQGARSALRRAQKATHESFAAYTASLDTERRVSQEVAALEDRRDHFLSLILRQNQRSQGANCPFPGCACVDGVPDCMSTYARKAPAYDSEHARYPSYTAPPLPPPPPSSGNIPMMRSAYTWDDRERDDLSSPHTSSASASAGGSPARKHARTWDSEEPPIRKRLAGSVSGSPPMHGA